MRKPPTIQDVAGALGMHKSTVSQALSGKGNVSEKTRARILSAARSLGYEPNPLAQRLANGYRNDLVCVFSGFLDTGLSTEKILLIQQRLSEHGLEAPIYACAKPAPGQDHAAVQAAQIKQLCRQRPRAIVCASQMVDPVVFETLDAYRHAGGVLVTYDTPVPLECDQVIFDREHNAYLVARHLLEQGHRRIGMAMSRDPWRISETENDPQTQRMRGFHKALREFGGETREEWLFRNAPYEKGGTEMARQFLQLRERPSAVAIVNDYVAMAFMVEVMRAGVRVPEDLSIVGHDDQPVAEVCPVPLTAGTQPAEHITRAVTDLVLQRIRGEKIDVSPEIITITGGLERRASVGPPPA